ncbi:hypothetical protein [Chishuiella sp.]|uniref:tetratricopeptide repeat protein n=1 Tax=Chishuiella sp. TaxID=1969467 RepID=UPI0028AC300D|nr:hypothetical protein [Chishuiella sp.]
MKKFLNLFFIFTFIQGIAQPNCNAYKYLGDSLQYNACKLIENVNYYNQFSREFQELLDQSLDICPYFAYAYREKSVAYLKSGDFLTWKKLIDLAVKHDELGNLDYRGWCKFQFFRDYKGAISDFERLEKLVNDIGYSQNGNYHLQIVKGICYSAIGDKTEAIKIINQQLNKENYSVGSFDYYQLAVTYFQLKDYNNALIFFNKQDKIRPLAEGNYYMAKIYKLKNNIIEYEKNKNISLEYYMKGNYLFDPYTHHYNKVYLTQIENL